MKYLSCIALRFRREKALDSLEELEHFKVLHPRDYKSLPMMDYPLYDSFFNADKTELSRLPLAIDFICVMVVCSS